MKLCTNNTGVSSALQAVCVACLHTIRARAPHIPVLILEGVRAYDFAWTIAEAPFGADVFHQAGTVLWLLWPIIP